jgi:mono/diheme cytochrome c family protein
MMRTTRLRRFGFVLASVIAALAVFGCGGDGAEPERTPVPTATSTQAAGDELIKGVSPGEFYTTYCATCHGQNREGGVGLPLTPQVLTEPDEFYHDVIRNGRPGTGMNMMGTILGMSEDEIDTLVRFLKTDDPNTP